MYAGHWLSQPDCICNTSNATHLYAMHTYLLTHLTVTYAATHHYSMHIHTHTPLTVTYAAIHLYFMHTHADTLTHTLNSHICSPHTYTPCTYTYIHTSHITHAQKRLTLTSTNN